SALYLWKQWSGRTDERTALLDSLLANPDTSQVVALEPEMADSTQASVDSSFARPQTYAMSPADSARMDSLRQHALQVREQYMREHGGAPKPRPQQQAPTTQIQSTTPSAAGVAPAVGAAAAGAAAGSSAPTDSSASHTPPPSSTAPPDSTARPDSTAHEDEDDTGP